MGKTIKSNYWLVNTSVYCEDKGNWTCCVSRFEDVNFLSQAKAKHSADQISGRFAFDIVLLGVNGFNYCRPTVPHWLQLNKQALTKNRHVINFNTEGIDGK